MNIEKEVKKLEEIECLLCCFKEKINDGLVRFTDPKLKDMYDHNYFYADRMDDEIFSICEKISKDEGCNHIKIVLDFKSDYLINKGFEEECDMTMLKIDDDYGTRFNDSLSFKNAVEDDIEQDIIDIDFKHYGKDYGDFCIRKDKRIIDAMKKNDGKFTFIAAYIDEKIVGFCSIVISDYVIGLDDLLVDEDHRHKLIATTLLKYIRTKYNKPIYLHADTLDTPKDMYFALGFKEISREYNYLKIKGE